MGRKLASNSAALLVGILFSLVFLEVALRIYNPIIQTIKGDRITLRVNYDETRHNTNIRGVAPESHIHQNSLGFRGADPPGDFTDRLTIIAVGGSTTRSLWQSDDRTWTALLGDTVADCFDRTWINNAGFDGHSTFAHIELIRSFISKLHPKVVLLLIGTNDVFIDARDVAQVQWLPTGVISRQMAAGFKRIVDRLAKRSEVVDLGLTLYRSFHAWQVGLNLGSLAETDAVPGSGDTSPLGAERLQPEYAERLRLIIRLLRDGQSIPVLMTQPTIEGIGRDPTTGKDLSRIGRGLAFYQALEIYNATMHQVAQSESVRLIDLAGLMPKDTKYYFDPVHYTDAGATKVAGLVSRQLLPYLGREFPSFKKGACQLDPANPA